MKAFILLLLIAPACALAGGGGGLHFDDKVKEVKKAECRSGASRLTFSDITWYDPEEEEFDSTNLVIETPGQPSKTYFVWAHSELQNIRKTGVIQWKKVAMQEPGKNIEIYFDVNVNFSTGEGYLEMASYLGGREFSAPFGAMQLSNCVLAR
ncbi:MAG: hypothetical protein AB7K68_00105 [Bacteriovoracia bacterium]